MMSLMMRRMLWLALLPTALLAESDPLKIKSDQLKSLMTENLDYLSQTESSALSNPDLVRRRDEIFTAILEVTEAHFGNRARIAPEDQLKLRSLRDLLASIRCLWSADGWNDRNLSGLEAHPDSKIMIAKAQSIRSCLSPKGPESPLAEMLAQVREELARHIEPNPEQESKARAPRFAIYDYQESFSKISKIPTYEDSWKSLGMESEPARLFEASARKRTALNQRQMILSALARMSNSTFFLIKELLTYWKDLCPSLVSDTETVLEAIDVLRGFSEAMILRGGPNTFPLSEAEWRLRREEAHRDLSDEDIEAYQEAHKKFGLIGEINKIILELDTRFDFQ